jgi:hypothetical protein
MQIAARPTCRVVASLLLLTAEILRAKCVLLQNGLSRASKLAGTSAAEHVLVSSDTRDSCEQIRIFCVMQWKMANKGDRDYYCVLKSKATKGDLSAVSTFQLLRMLTV